MEIASNFGQTGRNPADVNGDGVVNVMDLGLVAGAFGTGTAAPSKLSHNPQIAPTRADVQKWLREARQVNLTDPSVQARYLRVGAASCCVDTKGISTAAELSESVQPRNLDSVRVGGGYACANHDIQHTRCYGP